MAHPNISLRLRVTDRKVKDFCFSLISLSVRKKSLGLVSRRPRSEIKYQQKNHCGEVLNFFLTEDHKTTLTFCQVIILLYPKVLRGTLRVDLVIFRRRPALSKVSISKKLSTILVFFPRQNRFSRPNGQLLPKACLIYSESY